MRQRVLEGSSKGSIESCWVTSAQGRLQVKRIFFVSFLVSLASAWIVQPTTFEARNTGATTSSAYTGAEAVVYSNGTVSNDEAYYGFLAFRSTLNITAGSTVTFGDGCRFYGMIYPDDSNTWVKIDGFVVFAPSVTLPQGLRFSYVNRDSTIYCYGDLALSQALVFYDAGYNTTLTIDGGGRTLTLNAGASLNFGSVRLTLRNWNIVIKTTTPFLTSANTALLTLENVNLYLDESLGGSPAKYSSAATPLGGLVIEGQVTINGQGQTFDFNSRGGGSNPCVRVNQDSCLRINSGASAKMSFDTVARNNRLYLTDSSSRLHLENATLQIPVSGITISGLQLERGLVVVEGACRLDNEANTVTSQGLVLGDGTSTNSDVQAVFASGGSLTVSGCLYHNPA